MTNTLDEYRESFGFMLKADQNSVWPWQYYFRFLLGMFILTLIQAVGSALSCWSTFGYLDEKYLYHPFKIV